MVEDLIMLIDASSVVSLCRLLENDVIYIEVYCYVMRDRVI
ncbi:hypothetical protein V6Z11_A13G237800 [Gossypium hirsutum]